MHPQVESRAYRLRAAEAEQLWFRGVQLIGRKSYRTATLAEAKAVFQDCVSRMKHPRRLSYSTADPCAMEVRGVDRAREILF